MRTSLLLVLALVLAGGCSAPQSAVEVKVLVGLQRTPCFGRCPVYEFSMLNTGEATLKVGRFCEEAFGRAMEEGMHTAKVDPSAWQDVLDLAAELRFDTLASRYDNPQVTDLPASVVTIDGKTVFSRYGGPNLNDLFTRIEQGIGTTDWSADPSTSR